MAAFQVFVHRTVNVVQNVTNLPEAGFYNISMARIFANSLKNMPGAISAYDVDGVLIEVLKRPNDAG
jgi:hypothetical protein